ncbi:MAG: aminotransferase class III-fold pyridoxal phosphate-dependent enzyme [Alphaproteobacteria bacterium]|nr:aminotransferase class III-fold pyridoxal phosphate-dependent enzyme [Alphaproteobacteria bacterium]
MDLNYENDYSGIVEADRANVWHHLTQHKKFESVDPLIIIEGKGNRVWNQKGREHLDATSGGVWTVNVGYGRAEIADAVRDQLLKMNYFAGAMGTIPGARFAERLIEKMPGMGRVYYSNSGSEANEKAYKIVRQISHNKYGGKKHKILYRQRDYHGTTIAALASGGQDQRKDQYGPFPDGFVEVPHCLEYRSQFGDVQDYGVRAANAIEEVILREGADTVGALVLEPITAGGGVITPPEGYWERVQEICQQYEILLIIDEVVCGLGRTGSWFGYQQFGIEPDMVTMAKGVASGYAAISCTVTTEAVFDMFKDRAEDPMSYFRDISTFGGCTGGPAAALENMRILEDEKLLENCTEIGEYLFGQLEELAARFPKVSGQVRGKGLFQGLELVKDVETREPLDESLVQGIVADCMQNNAVIIGATNRSLAGFNNTLCLSPALISTKSDMDEVISAIDGAMGRVLA